MKAETIERIENFERSVAEINEQLTCLGPLVKQFLALRMNLDYCGVARSERIILNLRISEWPKQYKFCQQKFGNRILGMEINWCD